MQIGKISRKYALLFILLGVSWYEGFSQRIVDVKYEPDAKGGYVFSCFNTAYCNYILDLSFTTFTNLKCDQSLPFHGEVKPGYTKLFTIYPLDAQIPVQFKFGSGAQKGCMHPAVIPDFTYLLPVSPGKQTQVYEMSPDKSADSISWYVLRLKMKPGDTIFAARRGVVNAVEVGEAANDAGEASAGKENYIEIAQADCSFAHYGILKKNGAFVKPGQVVRAGQAMGLVGGDAFGRGSEIRFSVFYYPEENGSASRRPRYMITQVWTKKNGKGKLKHGVIYTGEFPEAVLNQEVPAKPKSKNTRPKTRHGG